MGRAARQRQQALISRGVLSLPMYDRRCRCVAMCVVVAHRTTPAMLVVLTFAHNNNNKTTTTTNNNANNPL